MECQDGARTHLFGVVGSSCLASMMYANLDRGVLDVLLISNFPGMRFHAFIKNYYGTMIHIPRERNLSRLYIPIKDMDLGGRADRSSIILVDLITRAKTFFAPFKSDVKFCEWWSVYQARQRVAEANSHLSNHIFLACDTIPMYSPKIGWGLNMSM
jgi:phenol 2-monooxygenase